MADILAAQRASQLPVAVNGWQEDIHDPHNWVQPHLIGTYGARQNIPAELMDRYRELVNAGVLASDRPSASKSTISTCKRCSTTPFHRSSLLQRDAPRYTQRWVNGYYYRVGMFGRDYYAYSFDGSGINPFVCPPPSNGDCVIISTY